MSRLTINGEKIASRKVASIEIRDVRTQHGPLCIADLDLNIRTTEFWKQLRGCDLLTPWGQSWEDALHTVIAVEAISSEGINFVARLRTTGGRTIVAKISAILNGELAREVTSLDLRRIACQPSAGFSYGKHDLILLFEDLGRVPTVTEELLKALDDDKIVYACHLLRDAGLLLASFHVVSMAKKREEPDVPGWNARLQRLSSATGYPVPSISEASGPGILTHGDFHFGQVGLWETGMRLMDFGGEPLRWLLGFTGRFPAIRDVACGLRHIDYLLYKEQRNVSLAPILREAFLEGWMARAPKAIQSDPQSLAAWEYDRALNELVYRMLSGSDSTDLRWWFGSRSTPDDAPGGNKGH